MFLRERARCRCNCRNVETIDAQKKTRKKNVWNMYVHVLFRYRHCVSCNNPTESPVSNGGEVCFHPRSLALRLKRNEKASHKTIGFKSTRSSTRRADGAMKKHMHVHPIIYFSLLYGLNDVKREPRALCSGQGRRKERVVPYSSACAKGRCPQNEPARTHLSGKQLESCLR